MPNCPQCGAPLDSGEDDFGRYHLIQPIGEGGMGMGYLAEQLEPISRRVAAASGYRSAPENFNSNQRLLQFSAASFETAFHNESQEARKAFLEGKTRAGNNMFRLAARGPLTWSNRFLTVAALKRVHMCHDGAATVRKRCLNGNWYSKARRVAAAPTHRSLSARNDLPGTGR